MNHCKECNTELTDDIKYTDDLCCPCYEKQLNDDYNEMVTCELCGNIWDGHAQCNCWEWYNIFDDEEEYDNDYFEPTSVADVYILDIIYKYD